MYRLTSHLVAFMLFCSAALAGGNNTQTEKVSVSFNFQVSGELIQSNKKLKDFIKKNAFHYEVVTDSLFDLKDLKNVTVIGKAGTEDEPDWAIIVDTGKGIDKLFTNFQKSGRFMTKHNKYEYMTDEKIALIKVDDTRLVISYSKQIQTYLKKDLSSLNIPGDKLDLQFSMNVQGPIADKLQELPIPDSAKEAISGLTVVSLKLKKDENYKGAIIFSFKEPQMAGTAHPLISLFFQILKKNGKDRGIKLPMLNFKHDGHNVIAPLQIEADIIDNFNPIK